MANAFHPPKSKAIRKDQDALSPAESSTSGATLGKAPKIKSPSSKFAGLSVGARLFLEDVDFYSTVSSDSRPPQSPEEPGNFQRAYSSIVSTVPQSMRLRMLEKMSRAIEAVTQEEMNAFPHQATQKGTNQEKVSTSSFMAGLRKQQRQQQENDIECERLLPGPEIVERLNISPQALSAAVKAKRMFAMLGPSGVYVYPAFFADERYERRVLEKVCKALGDLPAGSKWDFFTSPRRSLAGKTPLDALEKGQVDVVISAANAFQEK